MDALSEKTGEKAPSPLAMLKTKEIRHTAVVDIDKMEQFVIDSLNCIL